jgi:hydroxymethylglutaryl-CoA reductase
MSSMQYMNIYLRFCCMSGDAMGMNVVSKGCLKVYILYSLCEYVYLYVLMLM